MSKHRHSVTLNSPKDRENPHGRHHESPASSIGKRRSSKLKDKENRSTTPTSSSSAYESVGHLQLTKRRSDASSVTTATSGLTTSATTTSITVIKELPCEYYVNISVDGLRHMDQPNHLTNEEIFNLTLERRLRPISGVRHRIKPPTKTINNFLEETDLIDRVSRISTMKWLDLSSNNLTVYPKKLCNLELLEKLDLSNNNLREKDLPLELEKYQNLLEIVLDSNCLKDIPKSLIKFKKLIRLSIRNNKITSLKLLESLRKLRYLIADSNDLTQIDESLFVLDKLEMLHLSNNRISILPSTFLQSNLNNVKQLDCSFNSITFIPTEIFTLPHLDVLNLSNNKLAKLPILPVTFKRTSPIHFIDFSSNILTKFYEYLLSIALHIDLTSNRIKCLPSIAIRNLNMQQIMERSLKIDLNPLEYPPLDVCLNGLRIIKLFFEEAATKMHLKHGFKISILGDIGSGKTSLAYAIEDFHAQSNLIEHISAKVQNISNMGIDIPQDIQEKFIEAHEFFFKGKDDKIISTKVKKDDAGLSGTGMIKSVTAMPVSIFDINGSATQFGHINHNFIDKSSLIVLCIDITTFDQALTSDMWLAEKNLKYWLDVIFFKMSRTCAMYILPVCTKCDVYFKQQKKNIDAKEAIRIKEEIGVKLTEISQLILSKIHQHYAERLNYVRTELEKIESQLKISASESDRLKRYANILNYAKPGVHHECIVTSSYTMYGIERLNESIREIVYNNTDKYFPNVNKRIPTLWNEVENYVFSWLSHIQKSGFTNDPTCISSYSLSSLSIICMDFEEYKERITEKYGMDRMVEQITSFFNSQGKLLWLQDTPQWRTKVFFNLNILFDFVYILFKKDFESNFTNNQLKIIRSKLSLQTQNNTAYIQRLKNDLLNTGVAHIELLKFIWTPVMLNTSTKLLTEIVVLLMAFFCIGYPQVPKSQMKQIFSTVPLLMKYEYSNRPPATTTQNQHANSDDEVDIGTHDRVQFRDNLGRSITTYVQYTKPRDESKYPVNGTATDKNKWTPTFDSIVIPFYMPKIGNLSKLEEIRDKLRHSSTILTTVAFAAKRSHTEPRVVPMLSMKYTFLWTLVSGVFERFAVNCVLNTDLYYKMHWKDAIYAHNEQDNMAVLIYLDNSSVNGEGTDVIFEFYLIEFISSKSVDPDESTNEIPEPSTLMLDFETLWALVMQILTLFEETLSTLPSMIFDKSTKCPECKQFSFLGEWSTPKECQNLKSKKCSVCQTTIDSIYLVKPPSGKNLALQLKRMKRRLENLVQMRTDSAKLRSKTRKTSNLLANSQQTPKDSSRRRSSSRESGQTRIKSSTSIKQPSQVKETTPVPKTKT